jgi:hypothetical protein
MRIAWGRIGLAGCCVFAAVLSIVGMSGCSGGFQGAAPSAPTTESAPTVTHPSSVTVVPGQTATFSVVASGTGPFTYQWYENGVAIPGATQASYTTSVTASSQSGAVFTVVVSNAAGSVTSAPATLTVQSAAPLAKSLVASNPTPGYDATVLLVPTFAGGTAMIGSNGVGSSDITANAVSGASYPTPALTAGTTYTLTVTDAKGNVVSTTCLVTPQAVALTPITPGAQTEAPGHVTFFEHGDGRIDEWCDVDGERRNVCGECVDFAECGGNVHDHGDERGQSGGFGDHDDDGERTGDQHAAGGAARLQRRHPDAVGGGELRGKLSVEFEQHANFGRDELDIRRGECDERECGQLYGDRDERHWICDVEYRGG